MSVLGDGSPGRSVAEVHRRLEWANALRGIAALAVVLCHFGVVFWMKQDVAASLARRAPLYVGTADAPRTGALLAAVPVDLGAFGVALFFLLSGSVIAIGLDRYSRRGFVISRCMRILPTYAAGYLVTCTVIAVVGNPQHELSLSSVANGLVPGVRFLTGSSAPGDGIVWTLIIEMVFYAVCLVGFRALTRRWEAIAAVAGGCVLVQLLVAPPAQIAGSSLGGLRYLVLLAAPFLPVILIGVTLSACRRGQIRPVAAATLVPLLTATHAWLMCLTKVMPTPLVYKATFLAVIALFCLVWTVGDRWKQHGVTDALADVSYPLYVVHPVLGYATLSILVGHHVRVPVAILLTVLTVFMVAWLLHRLVEVPTHHLGRRWARAASEMGVPARQRVTGGHAVAGACPSPPPADAAVGTGHAATRVEAA